MAKCSRCGAETQLYTNDGPVCPACADALEGKHTDAAKQTPPAQGTERSDLKALRSMIAQAETILCAAELPEERAERAQELIQAAIQLAEELLTDKPAAMLGAR